jgi:hypothetical protein
VIWLMTLSILGLVSAQRKQYRTAKHARSTSNYKLRTLQMSFSK